MPKLIINGKVKRYPYTPAGIKAANVAKRKNLKTNKNKRRN